MHPITLHLRPHFFDARERPLVEAGGLSASAFRFDSGVCALRLQTAAATCCCCPSRASKSGPPTWTGAS